MYHPPSKRKLIIQRTLVYGLMSIAVVGLVTALVFVMLGYQFNRDDGKIEQGGLVQFDSQPNGATVTIDGTSFGSRTPSKTTMTAGQHFITIDRSGYQTWQKSVDVVPGTVLWLSYARLIPKDLKPADVSHFATVSSSAASPNAKWMAIKDDPVTPVIHLANLSRDDVTVSDITLPATTYTQPSEGKTQSFSLEKWDPNSRYLLVKHTYDDSKTEWLLVDTQDVSQTKNITTLLDIDASRVVFSGNNGQVLYAQIGHDVRKLDMGSATLSRPLVTNVAEFAIYDRSTIVYSTILDPDTGKRSVGYYLDGADTARTIHTYTDDGKAPLHVAVGKYYNTTYTAVAYGDSIQVYRGDLASGNDALNQTLVKTIAMPGGAQYLSIKTDGRFIIAQSGAAYKVYDLELHKLTTTALKGTTDVTKELEWLDGHMLWSDRDGMLRLYEFDGANQHDIMPVVSGQGVTLSPNDKYLYGIDKTADGQYHLERVQLILG